MFELRQSNFPTLRTCSESVIEKYDGVYSISNSPPKVLHGCEHTVHMSPGPGPGYRIGYPDLQLITLLFVVVMYCTVPGTFNVTYP